MVKAFRQPAWLVGVALGICSSQFAQAQSVPDAGNFLQQIQRKLQSLQPPQPDPSRVAAPAQAELKPLIGVTIEVREFRFVGNTLLSDAALARAVQPWVGKPLDFSEVKRVAQAVAATYRAAGWVVRAYLPQQDITEGRLTIQIVESVLGKVDVESAEPAPGLSRQVQRMVEAAQRPGQPINADAIDHAVLLIGDLPGVKASANLKPGDKDGETDVLVTLQATRRVSGDVGLDNSGAASTGTRVVSGSMVVNNPIGIGDQVRATLMHSAGNQYGQLGASLPVGSSGARLSTSASALRYALVGDSFSGLGARGSSSTWGLNVTFPLVRSRQDNLVLAVAADQKHFENLTDQGITNQYSVRTTSLSISGNRRDGFYGGGWNSGSLTWVHGRVNLDNSPNQAADSVTTRTQGTFNSLSIALNRLQWLTDTLHATIGLSGQWAGKNLDSSEKFYIGGLGGVRACASSDGSGSSGQLVKMELKKQLPFNLTATLFHDWGHVTPYAQNDFKGANDVNSLILRGVGAGLQWVSPEGLSVSAQWARKLGRGPAPSTTADRDRLWLTASASF